MKTGEIEYKRKQYILYHVNNDKTKYNYKITGDTEIKKGSLFTEKIRIESNNKYHDHSPLEFKYWLYFRDDTNWIRCTKTGLAKTLYINVFEGNISKEIELQGKTHKGKNWEYPVHLVIVQRSNDLKTVIVDIFRSFYTHKPKVLNAFLREHNYV